MKSIIAENPFYLKDQLVLWSCLSLHLSHGGQRPDGQEGDSWPLPPGTSAVPTIKWR